MLVGSVTQPFTPETPEWLKNAIAQQQKLQDAKNAEAVARWKTQAQEWITNGVLLRERGLPVAAFTVPKPKRIVFFDSGFGYADQGTTEYTDLQDPVLPPPVATVPSGIPDIQAGARDRAMFELLNRILAETAAIRAHFNI